MSNKLIADLMSFRARMVADNRTQLMFEGDFDTIDQAIATLRKPPIAAPQQAIPSDSDLDNLVTVDKRDLFDFVRGAIRDALENGLMDEQTASEEMAMFHNATERTDKCLSKLYAKPASTTAPIERDK